MLSFKNRQIHFDYQRCCQCGTCLAACTENALSASLQADGTLQIRWDDNSCTRCGRCVSVCPAKDLPKTVLTEQNWADCRSVWIGNALDPDVCYKSSSGGIARTLIASSLASGFCDCAYGLVNANEFPWAKGKYLHNGDDIIGSLANSMYLPIPVNQNLNLNLNSKTLLVVGTNCQLLAVENFYRKTDVKLIKVAIFCKQQKTTQFTDFMCRRLNARKGAPMRYRGGGWPGTVSIGKEQLNWEDAAGLPFGKCLWRIPGCLYCGNPLGVNADITLADPWGILTKDEVVDGKTLIIVRTKLGEKLLNNSSNFIRNKQLKINDAKQSVGWSGIKKEQDITRWRLGQVKNNFLKKHVYYLGEQQRRLYEFILERFTPHRTILKILNHLPFLG